MEGNRKYVISVASVVVAISALAFQILFISYSNKQSAIDRTLKLYEILINAPHIVLLQEIALEYERIRRLESLIAQPLKPLKKNELYKKVIDDHSSKKEVENAITMYLRDIAILHDCGKYENVFSDGNWNGKDSKIKETINWLIGDTLCDRNTISGILSPTINEIHHFNKRMIYCNDIVTWRHQDNVLDGKVYHNEIYKLESVIIDGLNREFINIGFPFEIFRTHREGKEYENKTNDRRWINVRLNIGDEC